jgi:hypothetical protein
MAENHQERCNPAIDPAARAFVINCLGMAKNMQVIKPTWYEAPVL